MGVNITELLPAKEVSFKDLSGKIVAVDASMFLYQFLTTIRQPDGTPLMDSKGNVTSHLSGLFFRTTKLMNYGIKLAYVFDGKAPELKKAEQARRNSLKDEAQTKYKIALETKDIEGMKKYAARTTRLTGEMVNESKELLEAMGIPIIQAPCEAEAQASHIVKNGDAYALASQDADTFMFGAPRVIRNLSLVGKKKKTNALSYQSVKPQIIELAEILNNLGIDQNQLIALCMLVGTDYNKGGIKGIGPKNALKLVKKYDSEFDYLFKDQKWEDFFETEWTEVYYTIKKMEVTDDYKMEWKSVNYEKIIDLLVNKHEFSLERVESSLKRAKEEAENNKQKGLGDFF